MKSHLPKELDEVSGKMQFIIKTYMLLNEIFLKKRLFIAPEKHCFACGHLACFVIFIAKKNTKETIVIFLTCEICRPLVEKRQDGYRQKYQTFDIDENGWAEISVNLW